MSIPTDREVIAALNEQYVGGTYEPEGVVQSYKGSATYTAFTGSNKFISILSTRSFRCESPACLAAPVVHIVAQDVLSLGLNEPEKVAARFFAPRFLGLTAREIQVKHVNFVEKPNHGVVTCQKLVFEKNANASFCEIVASWTADDTEIVFNP